MLKYIAIDTPNEDFDLFETMLQISVQLRVGKKSGILDDGTKWNLSSERPN